MERSLFDARNTGTLGIERAAQSVSDRWKEYALGFVRRYLETHRTLHVDQLWDAGLTKPDSARALGWVMQQARKQEWMRQSRAGGRGLYRATVQEQQRAIEAGLGVVDLWAVETSHWAAKRTDFVAKWVRSDKEDGKHLFEDPIIWNEIVNGSE